MFQRQMGEMHLSLADSASCAAIMQNAAKNPKGALTLPILTAFYKNGTCLVECKDSFPF